MNKLAFRLVPYVGIYLQTPLKDFFAHQKTKLHLQPGTSGEPVIALILFVLVLFCSRLFNNEKKNLNFSSEEVVMGVRRSVRGMQLCTISKYQPAY